MTNLKNAIIRLCYNSEVKDEEMGDKRLESEQPSSVVHKTFSGICIDKLVLYHDVIVFIGLPILWISLFVYIVNQDTMLTLWYMPLLGFFAAVIANCVPIGGGVVYIPALYLMGENMELGVAFTVATMSVGSGLISPLKWLSVDRNLIIWSAIPFTVLPAWKGFLVSLAFPSMGEETEKLFFGAFCLALAVFVAALARAGGAMEFARQVSSCTVIKPMSSSLYWVLTAFVSFLAGLILIPNIGIGPALTTFICLSMHGGIDTHAALVTGIVVGGWASWVPFAVHFLMIRDVPVAHWIMVMPGVFLGAQIAPKVYALLGMRASLISFAIFLVITAATCFV